LPRGAIEHDRRFCWGWRFRGSSSLDSTRWRLAETREACLEQARAVVRNELEHEPDKGRAHNDALGDVREYDRAII
jgi:hypothetical protein